MVVGHVIRVVYGKIGPCHLVGRGGRLVLLLPGDQRGIGLGGVRGGAHQVGLRREGVRSGVGGPNQGGGVVGGRVPS